MELLRVKDYDDMSEMACGHVAEVIHEVKAPVLGLATGSTPEGLYERLIEKNQSGDLSFTHTTTFNLDEYVGLAADDPNSYHYYMQENLFKYIDISNSNTHLPDGAAEDIDQACQDYEALLQQKGPVDLQLLGIGENGHIGFNEPGTAFDSRTQVVKLADSTIQANARFFDSMSQIPTEAVTMGIQSIMEAKQIIMMISGEKKAHALNELMNGEVTESFPASVLQRHPRAMIIADEAACSKL